MVVVAVIGSGAPVVSVIESAAVVVAAVTGSAAPVVAQW